MARVAQCGDELEGQFALHVHAVLECATRPEVRVEEVNAAADELRRGRRRRHAAEVAKEEVGALVGCAAGAGVAVGDEGGVEPGSPFGERVAAVDAVDDGRVVEASAAAHDRLVVERVCEPDAGPDVTVVRIHQAAVAGLQTSLAAGTNERSLMSSRD